MKFSLKLLLINTRGLYFLLLLNTFKIISIPCFRCIYLMKKMRMLFLRKWKISYRNILWMIKRSGTWDQAPDLAEIRHYQGPEKSKQVNLLFKSLKLPKRLNFRPLKKPKWSTDSKSIKKICQSFWLFQRPEHDIFFFGNFRLLKN